MNCEGYAARFTDLRQHQCHLIAVACGQLVGQHRQLTKGEPAAILMRTDDGRPHHIHRCAECQTALWSDCSFDYLRFARVSALNRPHAVKPDVLICTCRQVSWLDLPEDTPAFEVSCENDEEWSAAHIGRLETAKARYEASTA